MFESLNLLDGFGFLFFLDSLFMQKLIINLNLTGFEVV